MKKIIGILAVLIVLGGIVAFSQSSKNTSGEMAEHSTTRSTPAPSQSQKASDQPIQSTEGKVAVAIVDFKYSPETLTVKKGTTVTWTNEDSVAHTVTADDLPGPDSPSMPKGATYSYTFNEAGTFSYFCQPHTYMKAKVVVTE